MAKHATCSCSTARAMRRASCLPAVATRSSRIRQRPCSSSRPATRPLPSVASSGPAMRSASPPSSWTAAPRPRTALMAPRPRRARMPELPTWCGSISAPAHSRPPSSRPPRAAGNSWSSQTSTLATVTSLRASATPMPFSTTKCPQRTPCTPFTRASTAPIAPSSCVFNERMP